MNRFITCVAFLLALFLIPAPQASNGSWWVFCGVCESEMDFRQAVLAAPGGDRVYFVSNPDTFDSRKFEKRSTLEEVSGGVVQTTQVDDLRLTADEAEGLASVLQSAKVLHTELDRADIENEVFERDARSIAEDLNGGVLSASLLSWLRIALYEQGLFPDAQSASEAVGTAISRLFWFSNRNAARWWPLSIEVNYPDGSRLAITLSSDSQTWSLLQAEDAVGNILPVYGPDSSGHAPVDAAGFVGLEFVFGAGPGVEALLDWLNGQSNPALDCNGMLADKGRVRVTCQRAE